jgi:GT2 family glycosyltransferase
LSTVAVASVENEKESTSFGKSYRSLLMYDISVGPGQIRAELPMRYGTDGLEGARNEVVRQFLEKDCEYLFWVDTDMGFTPDTVERLMEVADPAERPIVAGLCFMHKELGQDGMGGFDTTPIPTIFDWAEVGPDMHGFTPRRAYVPNEVTRCGATGSACILIHRSVFEKIGGDWYTKIPNPETGKLMSEDISFCVRAAAAGCPVLVHAGVRTTHHKDVWVSEAQYWRSTPAPPATERVAVLVPVLNRPGNAAPFMESLRASTGLATAYAVVESEGDDETRLAWAAAGAERIDSGGGHTFAEKVNTGFDMTSEVDPSPWLFIVGDDVRFHPGWLDQALHVANTTGRSVIGTNDLGNRRTMLGEHGTHLLIRRSYVDEIGASWDGPKVVCHEGYRHWYVDDEIVTAAKQRGQWAPALGSVVEHLHPIWGKAANDDTYELGMGASKADEKVFRGRLKANS